MKFNNYMKKSKMKSQSNLNSVNSNQKHQNNKKGIELKDFLIPIISAILALFLNQLFFESNKRVEAQIEYEREMFKIQTPSLNRILAFSYKYEISLITFYIQDRVHQITTIIDRNSGETLKTEKKDLFGKIDTLTMRIPTFVAHMEKRNRLLHDLESLKEQRDYLDPEIYIAFDNIIEFLEENKLPNLENSEEMFKSSWKSEKIQYDWKKLVDELRIKCNMKIYKFKNPQKQNIIYDFFSNF